MSKKYAQVTENRIKKRKFGNNMAASETEQTLEMKSSMKIQ